MFPDNGTGLNARLDVLHVQHGDGRVTAAVFDLHMGKFVGIQNRLYVFPVTEDDFMTLGSGEHLAAREIHRGLFPDVDLYRGLLFRGTNIFNDFLCIHGNLSFTAGECGSP